MTTTTKIIPTPRVRLRRLRRSSRFRDLVRETTLTINDLVLPLFVKAGRDRKDPIISMPGHCQWSVDRLEEALAPVAEYNLPALILFGLPAEKDETGSYAWREDGVVQSAIRTIKSQLPDLLVIADLCFCEYTQHGHCGVLMEEAQGGLVVDNDRTLPLLAHQAVSLAQAGADIVAPSGMIDGMVAAIRCALDQASYQSVAILSYAVKYASAFYGPFADAADSAPQFGDRSTHQMDPGNGARALRESQLDVEEGADMLMVKPAGFYLDIIHRIKQAHPGIPISAYQVSGEFAMIKAAAEKGWLNERRVMMESLLAIKRAGANFMITYYALEVARELNRWQN